MVPNPWPRRAARNHRSGNVSSDFRYKSAKRITLEALAKGLEAESIELFDKPLADSNAIRVCGPFEVASLGRYSVEDWKGYVVREPGYGEAATLENYIEVICRLYRKDAAIQGVTGFVHAVAETEKEKIAISVGPLSSRVTGKRIPTIERPRRAGDPPALVASAEAIQKDLGWSPRYTEIAEIIQTAWKWHTTHPNGFAG